MSNEAFQLLSRGGVAFNKSRSEFQLFNVTIRLLRYSHYPTYQLQKTKRVKKDPSEQTHAISGEIPAELDFFKYTQGTHGKRKPTDKDGSGDAKRRKTSDDEHEDEEAPDISPTKSLRTAHRVTTKGTNIPPHINSFEEMKKYAVPSHLFSNLASSGYQEPTGIQSHCVPMLLEVCTSFLIYVGFLFNVNRIVI